MKTLLKQMGILVLAGLLAISCSKPGSVYDGTSWQGKTGEYNSLRLTFSDRAQKCMVLSESWDVNGLGDGLGFELDVEWPSRNSFHLQIVEKGETLTFYSGVINGDTMTLKELRKTENHTYQLQKIN